jgi:hypothetical protein
MVRKPRVYFFQESLACPVNEHAKICGDVRINVVVHRDAFKSPPRFVAVEVVAKRIGVIV